MDFWNWTLLQLAGTGALYVIVAAGAWLLYTTRPSTQARARARALKDVQPGPTSHTVVLTYEHSLNLNRVARVLLGPPCLLLVAWLLVRVVT